MLGSVLTRDFNETAPLGLGWLIGRAAAARSTPTLGVSSLHLRTTTAHVWAWIYGVDRDEVIADGFEPSKQEDWYRVRTMPDAVRFVEWIVAAHAKRA